MTEVMAVMPQAHLMVSGRQIVQQASQRIALESARFVEKSEALKAAQAVGLEAAKVTRQEGEPATTIDDTYRVEIDVSAEILRIKAAQRQVKLGVRLHSLEGDLNDDIKGLLR